MRAGCGEQEVAGYADAGLALEEIIHTATANNYC
jgi:hypothetical protein